MRNTHTKKEIKLGDLSCPFSDANAPVLFVVRVCFTWGTQLLTKSKRPRLPNQFPDSWFRVSSDAINFLGIWGRLYNSFGFYCVETLLSIQYSIHLEWQSSKLCLWFCAVEPCYKFPPNHMLHLLRMIASSYIEGGFTWSRSNVEKRNLNS